MLETVSIEQLISEMFALGKEASSSADLFTKFSDRLRQVLGIEYVTVSDAYSEKTELSGLEEFVLNTNKPYVDNRLSGYSAFPELIKHYNLGFRSCLMLPVTVEGKPVLVATFLSKQEDRFDSALAAKIAPVSQLLGYQVVAKVERERSISLARYFDAAFNTYVPQLLIDRSGVIIKANKSATGLFAKTQREMVGRNVSEFFSVDANMLYNLRDGAAAEVKDNFEAGRIYKVSCGKISDRLTHALFYDVTELKELEEKVRMSERSANEAFLLLAKDTTVLWSSGNIGKILKIGKEEITGRRLLDLAYQDKEFAGEIGSVSDTLTKPLKLGIGNDVFIDTKATLIKNRFGGFSCVLSRNNLEKYVSAMQSAIDGLVDDASDSILNIDTLGYIKSVNRSAQKLLGYNNSELSGSSLASLYADSESQQRLSSSLSIARSNGVVENVYVNMRTRSNEAPVPCEQAIRSMVDSDNNLVGYMIITKELATKIKMEELEENSEELGKLLKNEKQESDLKTQFFYNISHDLKTPLTSINGFGKLLIESANELTPEHREYVTIITNEADRLLQLIMQILDVAKLSSGRIKLELQQVDFNELLKNPAIDSLVEFAKKKGLEFAIDVDYSTPTVPADPNRLIQVFVNLIGNAIKFTDKGSIRIKIFKKGKSVRVEIADTGIGISKEDRGKLFKKFYQLQRKGLTVQEKSGTGLGLSIAKEIVSLHGGQMSVMSESGKGSTFWFTIPMNAKSKKAAAK
jgi:PAS domain S-box-containing protein